MKKQVSKTLIGGFVVGAVALLVVGVMIFGSGKLFERRTPYVLFFQESVKGLDTGSLVVFRGVPIGSVTDISLVADIDNLLLEIPVYIEIEEDKVRIKDAKEDTDPYQTMEQLIQKGLRGKLESKSLVTGQLMIELDFHPDKPANLKGLETRIAEIPTIPSTLQTIVQTIKGLKLDELTQNLSDTVAGFDRLVNSPEVKESLSALHGALTDAQKLIQHVDGRIDPLVDGVEGAVADSRKLLRDVNGKVDPLAANVNQTLDDAKELIEHVDAKVDPLAAGLRDTLAAATETVARAEETLKVVGKGSPVMTRVVQTLKELSDASRAIRLWAEYLERHPEALVRGKESN